MTTSTNHPPNTTSFSAQRLRQLAKIERWHFWFVGRRALVNYLLDQYSSPTSKTILDLGCGTGHNLQTLSRQGQIVLGLDIRPEGMQTIRHSQPAARFVQASATSLPFRTCAFDLVLALDVLEHIDDAVALAEIHRILNLDGALIASVPAFQWLWSYRDVDAGHLRRYSRRQLQRALQSAGFSILCVRYYQFFLFPLVVFTRLFGRMGPELRDQEEMPPRLINRAFVKLKMLEVALGNHLRWPWGSTLFAVGRKQHQ